MNKTKIEWCDSTWNPVTGCLHGCEYCYARRIAERFKGFDKTHGYSYIRTNSEPPIRELNRPLTITQSNGKTVAAPYPFGFEPTFHRYKLEEPQGWKKAKTIFVCSMADLFGNWVPDEWIEAVFTACQKAPQHRYLFLTKNPERYLRLARAGKLPAERNMWYGTTATTPDEHFFWGGAWHTFVSIEPILRDYTGEIGKMCDTFAQWVIVGAETGNRKGKVTPEKGWITEIVKTCIEKNIMLFMKDSLIPIVGEENMFRETPWDDKEKGKADIYREQKWLDEYYKKEEDEA